MSARFVNGGQRGVQRLDCGICETRRLRGATLKSADGGGEARHRRRIARHGVIGIAQIARDLLRLHHRRAAFGKRGLLARFRAQLC